MLKFRSSRLSTLISSLEDLKSAEKKLSQIQNKAFANLHQWSLEETNNTAIQDITNKLSKLYSNLESNLRQEKIESINNLTDLFYKFKEYDLKIEKINQIAKNAQKLEKKCFNDIKKCPANKSIRDYEVKHQKAQHDLQFSQFKQEEFSKEIAATKSILFKTNFKRLNETFLRENEAERVLLNAMNNLIQQIPDVSNEEVDDISVIQYTNHDETNKICNQANKKLTRLSSSRIKIEDRPSTFYSNTIVLESVQDQEIKQPKIEQSNNVLYPCLNDFKALNDSLNKFGLADAPQLHTIPPPTYSDSESYYNEQKQCETSTYRVVKPSAPSPPPATNYRSVSFQLEENQANVLPSSFQMKKRSSFNF